MRRKAAVGRSAAGEAAGSPKKDIEAAAAEEERRKEGRKEEGKREGKREGKEEETVTKWNLKLATDCNKKGGSKEVGV